MSILTTSGDHYTFPISLSDTPPVIGQSFDLVNATPGQAVALDTPTGGQLDTVPLNAEGNQYFYVYDAGSFSDAFSFSMSAGGGGWGASFGMAAEASALLQTSSLSQSIHFRGVKQKQQSIVKPNVALSAQASKVLASGVAAFVEKYGTHFVAGYVKGQRCNLSYNMNFSSMNFASKFSASFNESTSELGFSESMQTAINNALQTSSSQCRYTVKSDTRGFDSDAPSNMAELGKVLSQYNAASNADTPILLIIRPWTYLDAVDGAFGLSNNSHLSQLADLMSKYVYIQQTCRNFIDSSLFSGAMQLARIASIGKNAGTEVDAIATLLDQRNANGEPPTQADVDGIPPPEPVRDQMNVELARFWLAIVASTDAPDVNVPVNELAQQSSSIELSNERRLLKTKLETGIFFDWSQTHGMYTINGGDDNYYVGTVGFDLNPEDGTLKLWWQHRDGGKDESSYKKIFGIDTTLGPDDPNNSERLAWAAPGTSIRVAVCPK